MIEDRGKEFRWLLRQAFRYGTTERILYCHPDRVKEFERHVKEQNSYGYEVEVVGSPAVSRNWAFLVDPVSSQQYSAEVLP